MNFKPSDKVVCLSDNWISCESLGYRQVGPTPKAQRIYVVQRAGLSSNFNGIALVGSTVVSIRTGQEVGYDARYFRKLEEIQAENKLKKEKEEEAANAEALKEATQLINSEP